MTTASEKRELRESARARRVELAHALPDFAQRIAAFASDLAIPAVAIVGGYQALSQEANPSKLLDVLRTPGREIAYPRIQGKAQPLSFHVPVSDEAWRTGAFGILEPRPDWPRTFPSVLLVPLLAFDAEGYRLGYGGGYYDRTLLRVREEHPVVAVGIAYAGQEVVSVPHDERDERLDMVVTEEGVRRFRKA